MSVSYLTPSRVTAALPKRHSYTIHDKRRKGLCLRVAPSGRKTFEVNVMRRGVRHKETIGEATSMTLTGARAEYDKRLCELSALEDIGPETPFETMAELTMHRNRRLWKPSTMYIRRIYLKSTILPFFQGREIASISRRDAEEWLSSLQSKRGAANYCIPIISVIMREAEAMGVRPVGSNPMKGLRRYRQKKIGRALTTEEMARLGKGLEKLNEKDPLKAALIRLIVLTGCRKGEIESLHWKDYRDGHLHLRDSKTGPKMVFLSSHARAVLDGIDTPKSGFVFPGRGMVSEVIRIDGFWKVFRREAGLHDVRVHDLRHNYASIAIQSGESLTVVGTLLGHSHADTTLRYAHLDDGLMREAVEVVGKAISKNGGENDE